MHASNLKHRYQYEQSETDNDADQDFDTTSVSSTPDTHLASGGEACCECDLLLKATRGITVVVVSSRERKRRQPGLTADDPAFVGGRQLVRGIQGSQVHFDFI